MLFSQGHEKELMSTYESECVVTSFQFLLGFSEIRYQIVRMSLE